jgi:hypothetical protein
MSDSRDMGRRCLKMKKAKVKVQNDRAKGDERLYLIFEF